MLKILPTSSLRRLGALTIEREPIASIDLTERAAGALTRAVAERWDASHPITVFAGPAGNGGDALAVARMLAARGYKTEVYLLNPQGRLSEVCQTNRDRLSRVQGAALHEVVSQFAPPRLTSGHVVIDGLFGSGLSRPLAGGFAAVVRYINSQPSTVVSIDVPSGLMGEEIGGWASMPDHSTQHCSWSGRHARPPIIRADLTLSLQLPKLAFLFAENEPYVGEWQTIDIGLDPEAIDSLPAQDAMYSVPTTTADFYYVEHDDMTSRLKPRSRFAHKGDFGRALLIAGSEGMAGASILAARAALRAGVGLLTVHVPFCNNLAVQTAVPEAMTETDSHDTCFATPTRTDRYQAVGIGPGLRQAVATAEALCEQIDECGVPMVLDADALNLLGRRQDYLRRLPAGSLLTPHPTELERLVGRCENSYDRLMKACQLAQEHGVHVLLKGAYSALATPDGVCYFNSTGNPGMATAGSGDVLTGILLALLAQGYDTEEAALIGMYAHGLAGDIACRKYGAISMTAGDIVSALPAAWRMME